VLVGQNTLKQLLLALEVTRNPIGKMRAGGTLLFRGGTGGRRIDHRLGIVAAATVSALIGARRGIGGRDPIPLRSHTARKMVQPPSTRTPRHGDPIQ
jgi:hypothetical protein